MLVPSMFGEESDLLECFVWCKVFLFSDMVDGRNPAPVEVGGLSHYLQGFIDPRWLFGISSINSSETNEANLFC